MKIIQPKYIYLLSGLPSLSWANQNSSGDIRALCLEIRENLHPEDRALWEYLFFPYDLDNLLRHRFALTPSPQGLANYSQEDLNTFEEEPESIPPLFQAFWELSNENEEGVSEAQLQQKLYELYYTQAQVLPQPFLRSYLRFFASYQTLLSDWVAKDFDQAIPRAFQEDLSLFREEGAFYAEEIEEYASEIQQLWENQDIRGREEGLDAFLFERLEALRFSRFFGLDSLLIYGLQLQLLYRWQEIEQSDGVGQFEEAIRLMETQWKQSA